MEIQAHKYYKTVDVETPEGLIQLRNVYVLDKISREGKVEVVLSVSPAVCDEDWIVDYEEGDFGE